MGKAKCVNALWKKQKIETCQVLLEYFGKPGGFNMKNPRSSATRIV